jgi:BirA family biotin operon repressor/biotin-[acetyl-CoA-carboxylase] ligase
MEYPVIHLDSTDSTSNYLKQWLTEAVVEEGTVVYTDFQTAGRGQRGNGWESEKGKNLLFSIVLYPYMIKANEQFIISQAISLAIKDSLNKYLDSITIKWPNDIYWQEKKICGMLIENTLTNDTINQSVIGIGININQDKFSDNIPNPVSIKQITGKEYKTEDILHQIYLYIMKYYADLKGGKTAYIREKYQESLFRNKGYHLYNDGISDFEARIQEVQPSGILSLELRDGTEREFAFKEVRYIL